MKRFKRDTFCVAVNQGFSVVQPTSEDDGTVNGLYDTPIVAWIVEIDRDDDGDIRTTCAVPVTTEVLGLADNYAVRYPSGDIWVPEMAWFSKDNERGLRDYFQKLYQVVSGKQ